MVVVVVRGRVYVVGALLQYGDGVFLLEQVDLIEERCVF